MIVELDDGKVCELVARKSGKLEQQLRQKIEAEFDIKLEEAKQKIAAEIKATYGPPKKTNYAI